LSPDPDSFSVKISDASNLIRAAVTRPGGLWADLGAGSGTFTAALASLLREGGVVYAVDRVGGGREAGIDRIAGGAEVVPMVADFREPLALADLDGVVMANSLHFIASGEQAGVLARVVSYVRTGGAVVLVEYDQARESRWVPYPVPFDRFGSLARDVGLGPVREIGRRRSVYGPRDIYAEVVVVAGSSRP
jgi:SAM-dependent methyltransferase